jgi:dienelactone hydrolase
MARNNMPVKGVVSFHGDLSTTAPATKVTPRVLVCTGKADAFVPPEQVAKFEAEMKAAGANYKVIAYDGAHHSFTNPDADRHKIPNIQYDAKADQQSWEEMKRFFADVLK